MYGLYVRNEKIPENQISADSDLLSIKLLGKVVILTDLDGDFYHYEMSYSLPFSRIGNLLKFLWIYYGYRKNSEVLIAQV
jgi:hypothetical protein